MAQRRIRSVTLLALSAALAACGGGPSDEDEASDTARAFLDAVADGDGRAGCEHLSDRGEAWVTTAANAFAGEFGEPAEGECASSVERLAKEDGASGLATAEIKELRVRGVRAYAVVDSSFIPGLELERKGDSWKIADGYSE